MAVHTNGATQYVPLLSELMWDNAVWIHPQTAREKGIKSGDDIWLENATGKEKVKRWSPPEFGPIRCLFIWDLAPRREPKPQRQRTVFTAVICFRMLPVRFPVR